MFEEFEKCFALFDGTKMTEEGGREKKKEDKGESKKYLDSAFSLFFILLFCCFPFVIHFFLRV